MEEYYGVTELKDVTKIADSLLNVEQSLQKEMEAEMLRLISKDTFDIILRNTMPKGKQFLNSVWAFK